MSFSGEERFQGGTLVGTYNGIAKNGIVLIIKASDVAPEGHYVVLQKDNDGLDEDDWQLHVANFMAFGERTDKITGYTKSTQIRWNPHFHSPLWSKIIDKHTK